MPVNSALAEIDLTAIANNFTKAQSTAPHSKIMAVIKADAYGHGIVPVARRLEAADAFGVARLDEGITLRESGIKTPITLLEGILDSGELAVARQHQLDLVVHSDHQLAILTRESGLGIWLKLETGMHRLGLPASRLDQNLAQLKGHKILGLMSHLANADKREASATESQLQAFLNATRSLSYDKSLANSAGILGHPGTRADWNRPGVMLYGATPFADLEPVSSLRAAMTLTAPVIAINQIRKGDTVGYGSIWRAQSDSRIAILAIGYADGYPREAPMNTPVLVNGERRTLAGRVSMDMLTIELSEKDGVAVGDSVVLWGKGLPIEEISRCAGTIPYTLMCGVAKRVPRNYVT
ncbi:MAG: alanine racemase [Gammaproteobacteria bacterium]|nr:alanine racemase [Gammaproteobacteria bacterium]